jgi:hypothetical protein
MMMTFSALVSSAPAEGSDVYGSSILRDPWDLPKNGGDLWENPRAVFFKADVVPTEDGKRWIRIQQDIVGIFPVPLDSFFQLFLDFSTYTQFMPRMVRCTLVSSRDAKVFDVRNRYEVNILGYRYPTEYLLQFRVEKYTENRMAIRWHLLFSDGTIGGAEGGWFLETIETARGSGTIVRNLNVFLIRQDFPLQVQIMNWVGAGELEGMFRSIYKEIRRRRKTGPT